MFFHLHLHPSVEIFRLDDPLAFLEEGTDFTASPIEIDSALVWRIMLNFLQDFARLGQFQHQRMITPDAFVTDVHAGFAQPGRFDDRAVDIDCRLLKD